jgi:hypothetical protein
MSLFVPGMRCTISGRPIHLESEAIMFPPFVANEADPIHIFSDAVVHAEVFRAHSLAVEAQARLREAQQRTAPTNRECAVCKKLITHPDNYLGLGYLVADRMHPLYRFNYAHFHRSCLSKWSGLRQLIMDIERLDASGIWKGESLKRLLNTISTVTRD